MPLTRRPTLSQGLDREVSSPANAQGRPLIIPQVYQIVRKLADEQSQYNNKTLRLTVSTVYDRVKRSNSSLNRKSKRLLEDSIERVISVIKEEDADNDSGPVDGDFNSLEETGLPDLPV
jgi:ribosome biogenesis ATPase